MRSDARGEIEGIAANALSSRSMKYELDDYRLPAAPYNSLVTVEDSLLAGFLSNRLLSWACPVRGGALLRLVRAVITVYVACTDSSGGPH